jgi:hypothetical protein
MISDDDWFLALPGIVIYNDRKQEDFAYVYDNLFSGIS